MYAKVIRTMALFFPLSWVFPTGIQPELIGDNTYLPPLIDGRESEPEDKDQDVLSVSAWKGPFQFDFCQPAEDVGYHSAESPVRVLLFVITIAVLSFREGLSCYSPRCDFVPSPTTHDPIPSTL
jgi:hypothetical protein